MTFEQLGLNAPILNALREMGYHAPSPIQVDVAGGDTLKVGFQRTGDRFTDVTLTGPADLVFTGDIQI